MLTPNRSHRIAVWRTDPAPLEFLSGLQMVAWAYLFVRHEELTLTPSAHVVLADLVRIIPLKAWAVASFLTAVLQLFGAFLNVYLMRRYGAMSAIAIWTVATVEYIKVGAVPPAITCFLALALANSWVFISLGAPRLRNVPPVV